MKESGFAFIMVGMRFRRVLPLLLGVGLLGGVVAFLLLRPQVVAVFPAAGTQDVPRDAALQISFSQRMQAESVAARLHLEPEIPGTFRWVENTLTFQPEGDWPQGARVNARLDAGARSWLGLGLDEGRQWTFEVAATLLGYLWPAEGPADIYALELESGETTRLTEEEGVLDFDVNAAGTMIYYSAENPQGGSDLRVLERFTGERRTVLDCGTSLCRSVQVSPDEGALAFTRLKAEVQEAALEIWALHLEEGQVERVSAAGHETRLPAWSPEGMLSYYDADEGEYIVLDLDSGETTLLPNETGESGDWAPDGGVFVAPELYLVVTDTLRGPSGEAEFSQPDEDTLAPVQVFSSHLLAYNRETAEARDLTREDNLEDAAPSFSPGGEWVAFGRKFLDPEIWSPGRQLWLMRPNGAAARALTDAPEYKHTAFAWHPDGTQIAYLRFNQTALTEPPEIWLIQVDGSGSVQVVIGGFAPQWIP